MIPPFLFWSIGLLIDGKPGTTVSVLDRGIQYGDGLFETIAAVGGRPALWQRHLDRLRRGCSRLHLEPPDGDRLLEEVQREIDGEARSVIKILLTRGVGGRGYRPAEKQVPTRIVYRADWPDYPDHWISSGVRVRICDTGMGRNKVLAGMKTLNRLEQVLARMEWNDPDIPEGLMLDREGLLIEGTMSNLFLIQGERILTPDLTSCGVAGVMRELVMEQAEKLGSPIYQGPLTRRDLASADGLFLTNSLIGLWPVRAVEEREYDPGAVPSDLVDAVMDHGFRFG